MPKHLNPTLELSSTLKILAARATQALEYVLPIETQVSHALETAMRYAVLGGGKRLRPLLVYAAAHALGYDNPKLDAPACTVELIHAYSLVHDDLPAMDDADLRRGHPSCHKAFGEAIAILAGDALQTLAFQILAKAEFKPTCIVAMLRVLATACGTKGMVGGQALDLTAAGKNLNLGNLELLHAHKTGALIRAAVRLGALTSDADNHALAALDHYAAAVGLAFQVRDDLLDVEGSSSLTGKTAGKDVASNKPTFPSVIGMDASRQRLVEEVDNALDALTPFGKRGALLAELARYATQRDY